MTEWSAAAIRNRRTALGFSQSDVAAHLGVTKSMLSHIESGKRQPTQEQIDSLAVFLKMPSEMMVLAAGRLPKDVEHVIAERGADAVAAIRQIIEAEAVSFPTVPSADYLPKGPAAVPREAVAERVDARKTSAAYRAHSYHTKVPPEAVQPFIKAFTNPGDTVLDPFCGSGMTGVAALMEGRNALLSDLSPAAVHISKNYTTPCDVNDLAAALDRVAKAVTPTIDWLYRSVGSDRTIEYTTWSDVYRCAACRERLVYWERLHASGISENGAISCPRCGTCARKADLAWIGEEPVVSHTSKVGSKMAANPLLPTERALVEMAEQAPIPYWVPNVPFGPEREMWRASHSAMGIASASNFFTNRNLHALAALRHAIVVSSEGRTREALMFAFTAAVNRASKRYQWNAKRPTNVMTGTLYVSSLRYEWNVWSLFRRKAADVLRYYASFPETTASAEVFQRSASDLGCLPDRSIDFVFMDPPFGANIFYADASLLWEAWLGDTTDEAAEIVVNKSRRPSAGGKTLADYADLMTASFSHVARVLRPGGRAVLAFSNSDDNVWEAVREGLKVAGLDTASVHLLDKGQASIKGIKGQSGKENVTTLDLLLCLQHDNAKAFSGVDLLPIETIDEIILELVSKGGGRTDAIYSGVLQALLASKRSVAGVTMPIVAGRCRALGAVAIDGRWQIPVAPVAKEPLRTDDFVDGYLTMPGLLPESCSSASAAAAFAGGRVAGGRGSPFYLAHSYHTKVPPEAIQPFIEHYTKPGDVVLDPFCGSGMTGVAAAMAGRRAIMNDLSPAAVHLAWNHTRPCEPDRLGEAFEALENKVGEAIGKLYATPLGGRSEGLVHWTIWSTKHRCPTCGRTFLLWDAMDRATGRLGTTIDCPCCKAEIKRSGLAVLSNEPAWISYEDKTGRRHEKAAGQADVKRALSHQREDIEAWYPTTSIGPDREMYVRCALHLQGVESVSDFYTPRNLRALALIWDAIMAEEDERARRALAFAFTNTAWHGTKMRRFNARGGQRPLTGTLYIPQLSSEANVLEVMRNKIAQLKRYYQSYDIHGAETPAITLGSATNLTAVADASIDYIFTDPPFGSNIFYSDCNLIWEAWLGRLTASASEAVVNRSLTVKSGGKSLSVYANLMTSAMKEMARVLKPEGWATVVFHNTDAAVWKAIHDAALEAGFTFHEASSLDRKQQSHKGYKGRSGKEDVAHFDVVFNLRKSKASSLKRAPSKQPKFNVVAAVKAATEDPAIARHGLQGVHAEVMRRLASRGHATYVDFAEIRTAYETIMREVRLDPAA